MNESKQRLLERLDLLIRQAQSITFIVPDDTGFFSLENDLMQRVQALIDQSLLLMRELGDAYEKETPASAVEADIGEDDVLLDIGAAISAEIAAQEVANLAFVARTQLAESQEGLQSALESRNLWIVASHADSGLRRAAKGLISLESAIREYEELPAIERRWSGIHDAIEIRQLYAQFRRAVLRDGAPAVGEVESRLSSLARRIAILRDLNIYPFLRISDRRSIRHLQKRIFEWLEDERPVADKEQEGRQLWSDLCSFAELLVGINHREELREHDRRLIKRVYRLLFEGRTPQRQVPPSIHSDLEKLIGRDTELDRIVLNPARGQADALRQPLQRVHRELDASFRSIDGR